MYLQGSCKCHRLLVVHVIVHRAVNQEECFITEFFWNRAELRLEVAIGVILQRWKTHEAFGVNGIWENIVFFKKSRSRKQFSKTLP